MVPSWFNQPWQEELDALKQYRYILLRRVWCHRPQRSSWCPWGRRALQISCSCWCRPGWDRIARPRKRTGSWSSRTWLSWPSAECRSVNGSRGTLACLGQDCRRRLQSYRYNVKWFTGSTGSSPYPGWTYLSVSGESYNWRKTVVSVISSGHTVENK